MRLFVKQVLSVLERLVELPGSPVEFFRMILTIDLKHALALQKCLKSVPSLHPLIGAILGVEAGFGFGIVLAVFSLTFGAPLSIRLNLVSILIELVKVGFLLFTIL